MPDITVTIEDDGVPDPSELLKGKKKKEDA